MREFFNKYGAYIAVVAIALAALVWFLFGRSTAHVPNSAFFIDEDTGQESVRPAADVPPLDGAKGNQSIVKVYKYSCDGDKTVKVGYYIKFTPEMKAKMEELQRHPDPNSLLEPGSAMLVRSPETGSKWVKISSPEGQKIAVIECPSGNPVAVYP